MFFLALRGVAARKLRAFLTAAAIFFGVAMVAGTLILTDTINNSFDNIFSDANARTDVTVKPTETVEDSRGGEPPAFSADLLGPETARAGYKCPHCGLFVPLDRTEETEPADAA